MNRTLNVTRKTGFLVTDKSVPISILDFRGISFYRPGMVVDSFNLPTGKYIIDSGAFTPMINPVKFKLESLPMAETAFAQPPVDFKIFFDDNRNKCSIFWKEKMIVFDRSFADKPLPELYFIYLHEFGHAKYGYKRLYTMKQAEAFCDMYASNEMLRMGFNPSQIMAAPRNTLSDRQEYRKNYVEDTLLNNA